MFRWKLALVGLCAVIVALAVAVLGISGAVRSTTFGNDLHGMGFTLSSTEQENPTLRTVHTIRYWAATVDFQDCKVVLIQADKPLQGSKKVKGVEMAHYSLGWMLGKDGREIPLGSAPALAYPTPESLDDYFKQHPDLLQKCQARS